MQECVSLVVKMHNPYNGLPVYGEAILDARYEWYCDNDGAITLVRDGKRRTARPKERRSIHQMFLRKQSKYRLT